ncbi:MAG: hypothetical protein JXM79_24390 [Sedimentisphaerales bacterium]|nr:hypothetical protein [Sedimentisphaerales bacterium]
MCKKLVYILSIVMVLGLVGNVPAQEVEVIIRNPDMAMPVLDGVVDEVWSLATEQSITNMVDGTAPSSPADCSGTWRALWNWDYLYILVDVQDETLVQDSSDSQGWLDDRVEIFIDGENDKATSTDENDYQYNFRWNHGDVEIPVEWYNSPESLKGVEYAVVTTASGYLLEVKLPWLTMIGGSPQSGHLIGIDLMIDDDDDGGDQDTCLSWYMTPTGSPHDPSLWGTAELIAGNKAGSPNPSNGSLHSDTWANLSWGAAPTAVSHDVYIGDDFDTVSNATHDSDAYRGNQTVTFFVVGFPGFPYPEGLVPGTTYYWRIDEINAEGTVYKGDIWSFSIPPRTAYAPDPADGAEFIGPDVTLAWTPGYGAKMHHLYLDDNRADVEAAAPATYKGPKGTTSFDAGTLELEKVYYWRVDEFDGIETHPGDIWSFTTPGAVGNPQPSYNATDAPMNVVLSWTPADSAASHQLYFGADKEAVRNADTGSPEYIGTKALGAESYDPGLLDADATYAWRVDEVDEQGNISKGPLWIFTTGSFLLVEDFERYTDDDAAGEAIWQTWIDGYGLADNGAQVGYLLPPYAEQAIVHCGSQSMPLMYTNDAGASNSEASMSLTATRDWTEAGVTVLSLWVQGSSANAAEPMYVAISNTSGVFAIVVHDDANAAQARGWTKWDIPLQAFADQGINLSNVDKMAIGLGSKGGASVGGSGTVYIDDIRLYRP